MDADSIASRLSQDVRDQINAKMHEWFQDSDTDFSADELLDLGHRP